MRLASLRDSPDAFGATLEEGLTRSEDQWRDGLAGRVQFVAFAGKEPVGTAGGIVAATGDAVELVSMWVRRDHRREGVGGRLIGAVVDWAQSLRVNELRLWVVEDNLVAERAYAKNGFSRTGAVQLVRPGEPRMEFEMVRRLDALPGRRPVRVLGEGPL